MHKIIGGSIMGGRKPVQIGRSVSLPGLAPLLDPISMECVVILPLVVIRVDLTLG